MAQQNRTTIKSYFETNDVPTEAQYIDAWDSCIFFDGDFLDEDNMASDSATKVASQQSIKAYVDNNSNGFLKSSTTFYETIYIDAGAMLSCTTDGAAAATEEYGTNDIDMDLFLFDGTTTDERTQFKLSLPDDWNNGTVKAKFYWDAASGASPADGVVWSIKAGALSNDDPIDTALGTAQTVTDTVIAVGDMHITAATPAITIAGSPAADDMIIFEVSRLQSNGSDTMAEDAKLFGVKIQFLRDRTASAW